MIDFKLQRHASLALLAAAIACGGVAAPVLLLWGLSGMGATEASLCCPRRVY